MGKNTKYEPKDITPKLLKELTEKEGDHPFIRKTHLATILRISNTKLKSYQLDEEMPSWRQKRVAELLNMLIEIPEEEQMDFIKDKVKKIEELRAHKRDNFKTSDKKVHEKSPAKRILPLLTEGYVAEQIVEDLLRQNPNLKVLKEKRLKADGKKYVTDLISIDSSKKIIELIEIKLNLDRVDSALEQIAFYMMAADKYFEKDYPDYDIQGHLVCYKASSIALNKAKAVGVKVSEIGITINSVEV